MSPRRKEANELIRAESKEKIILAALKLFARSGYHATSVSSIAKEAGISKGLIYNYFESKEEILKGIIGHLMDEGEAFMHIMAMEDPKESMRQLILTTRDFLVEKKELWRLAISLSVQEEVGKFEFLKEMITQKAEGFFQSFMALLNRMGHENPKEEAMLLGALFDGMSIQYIVMGDEYPLEEITNTLIRKYCE